MNTETITPTAHAFSTTLNHLQRRVIEQINREAKDKHLYYHTLIHPQQVRERAKLIFQILAPHHTNGDPRTLQRQALLLDLCALSHDMVQIFREPHQPHTPRRRGGGVSERESYRELIHYITEINPQIDPQDQFTPQEMALIEEMILGTICDYDPQEGAIYQPVFSDPNHTPSLVTQVLALADIGFLGMKGIADYNQEGTLLFLEENPDIIPLITQGKITTLEQDDPTLSENLRQRLLRRTRFQVNFAKSRLKRIPSEFIGFPSAIIPQLQARIFPYLTEATIEELEATTPTAEDTSLKILIDFFGFEQFLKDNKN